MIGSGLSIDCALRLLMFCFESEFFFFRFVFGQYLVCVLDGRVKECETSLIWLMENESKKIYYDTCFFIVCFDCFKPFGFRFGVQRMT